jgi:hypothetical protein
MVARSSEVCSPAKWTRRCKARKPGTGGQSTAEEAPPFHWQSADDFPLRQLIVPVQRRNPRIKENKSCFCQSAALCASHILGHQRRRPPLRVGGRMPGVKPRFLCAVLVKISGLGAETVESQYPLQRCEPALQRRDYHHNDDQPQHPRVQCDLIAEFLHHKQAFLDALRALVGLVEALVDLLESLVDLLESLIDLFEPLIETLLHRIEAVIHAFDQLLEAMVHARHGGLELLVGNERVDALCQHAFHPRAMTSACFDGSPASSRSRVYERAS